jgi:hypothetical protein
VRFRVKYDAPDACPDKEGFIAKLNDYADADWQASPGEAAATIRLAVKQHGDQYVASMLLTDADGCCCGAEAPDLATDCSALVTTMAYRVSEALEQNSCLKPPPPPPRPPEPPPPREPPPEPPPERRAELGPAASAIWFIQVDGSLAWEHPALGGGLVLGVRWPKSPWLEHPWSMRLMAGYYDVPKRLDDPDIGTFKIRLQMARGYVCPVEVPFGSAVTMPLCALGEVGLLFVDPSILKGPPFWGALGIAPRLRAQYRAFFAEFEPSLVFPTMRHQSNWEGGESEDREDYVNWIALGTQLTLGAHF